MCEVRDLAAEIGIPVRDLHAFVRFIRDIRDDREMRPRLRAVHPHTILTASQANWIRTLNEMGESDV